MPRPICRALVTHLQLFKNVCEPEPLPEATPANATRQNLPTGIPQRGQGARHRHGHGVNADSCSRPTRPYLPRHPGGTSDRACPRPVPKGRASAPSRVKALNLNQFAAGAFDHQAHNLVALLDHLNIRPVRGRLYHAGDLEGRLASVCWTKGMRLKGLSAY